MPWERNGPSARSRRLPANWKTIRKAVLKRDAGICHLCGQPGADTVDHVIPGDDHRLENLAPVHDRVEPHCHRAKSSAEGVAALRAWSAQTKQSVEQHPGRVA